MGRVGYGPSLSWAEFVMGRYVQLPIVYLAFYRHGSKTLLFFSMGQGKVKVSRHYMVL